MILTLSGLEQLCEPLSLVYYTTITDPNSFPHHSEYGSNVYEVVNQLQVSGNCTTVEPHTQWNPSNMDTIGTEESVRIKEVSLFHGCP